MITTRSLSAALLLHVLALSGAFGETAASKPKLILQITVDQMRGDFPMRYEDRLGEGGFRYLMKRGTHYRNTHFQHADTETPVGHASLFTGTYPAHNGIVAGNWFDRDKGRVIYNCEDDRYRGTNYGSIRRLSRTVSLPACVGDHQKVARKVSMSTKVSMPAWSQDPVGLSEKQPSRSWTKPSTSGGGLGADPCQRPQ